MRAMKCSATKLVKPILPEPLTDSSVARYKNALRAFDRNRIENHTATRQEVQIQNSLIPAPQSFRILNYPEVRA